MQNQSANEPNKNHAKDIKSKKYAGVYYRTLSDNSKTFFIIYKNPITKKTHRLKIGNSKDGFNEAYSNNKRADIIARLRLGDDENIPILRLKRQKTTLNNLALKFFEAKAITTNRRSLSERKSKYNKHIKDTIGVKPLNSITSDDAKELQKSLINAGYANSTINHIIELVKTIFNYGIKEQIFKNLNPFSDITHIKTDNARLRYLSTTEIKELLNVVKSDEILYLFTLISLHTGARIRSVLNIKFKDINFDENIINLTDLKNKSFYIGALTSGVKQILQSKKYKKDDFIVSYTNGEQCQIKRIQRRLKPILDELFNQGLEANDAKNRVVIHTLRHTFASHLAIQGTPIFTIQKLINHKDIKNTMRYAKLSKESGINEVLRAFEN